MLTLLTMIIILLQACGVLGGSGLAATDTNSRSQARTGLLAQVTLAVPTDESPLFWLGGATSVNGSNAVSTTYSWYVQRRSATSVLLCFYRFDS